MATKDLARYISALAAGGQLKLASRLKRADEPELDSEHPAAKTDAGTQEVEPGSFFEEQEERMEDVGEQTPGEEPEIGPARAVEETPEGAELYHAGGGEDSELPKPEESPTEEVSTPAEMDELKSASVSQLVKAANDLMLHLALQLHEISQGGQAAVAAVAPGFLVKTAMNAAQEAAERQADLITATLNELVKIAVEEASEAAAEAAESEQAVERAASEEETLAEELAAAIADELQSEGVDVESLSDEEMKAISDAVVETLAEEVEEDEENKNKEKSETSEDESEDEGEDEGVEALLQAMSESPSAAATPPEAAEEAANAVANATDQELLDAAVDASKSASVSWDKIASSGPVGRTLVEYMARHVSSGRYRPLYTHHGEKRARAQRLRDYMETFLSELVQTNSR